MAEFCIDCWLEINEIKDDKRKYILSKDVDFCEGCGKWKPVVVMERKEYYLHILRFFTFPIRIIFNVIYFIWRLMILPYLIYKYKKSKNKNRS